MPVTQKDVAERLNISRSLVAGVLNNRPTVWASEETRRRIIATAREMNYRPNAAAQSLRTGKTRNVLLAYVSVKRPNDTLFHGAVERLAEAVGAIDHRLIVNVQPDRQKHLDFIRDASSAGMMDAAIIWSDLSGVEDQVREARIFAEHNVPFIIKGRFEQTHPEWLQIDFDHEGMMRLAVEHLVKLGHRRIAFMGMGRGFSWADFLCAGYLSAMRRNFNEEADPALVSWMQDDVKVKSAKEQMAAWLELPERIRPTAVVVGANNNAWWGIESALYERGLKIGFGKDDLAVAGLGWGNDFLYAGEGVSFDGTSMEYLAGVMSEQMLTPLLTGVPLANGVVRVLPSIKPVGKRAFDEACELLSMVRPNH